MTKIDFSSLRKPRKPTKKEAAIYRSWVKYLSGGKLNEDTIHERAADYTSRGLKPAD